jgi:Cu/Ag efflux protein CusF
MQKFNFAALVTLASVTSVPAVAVDSSTTAFIEIAADHDHGAQGAKGKGVVNSVDAAMQKVNVSHGPIPSLGWPAMKMDFAVAPTVDLNAIKPGSQIDFTVGKNKAGLPEIQSIQPIKK